MLKTSNGVSLVKNLTGSDTPTLHKLGIHLFSKLQKKSEINVYCPKKWGHFGDSARS